MDGPGSRQGAQGPLMKRPNQVYKAVLTAPRLTRIAVGFLLVVAGFFGFLPVLGYWMIPLGIIVVLFDVPWIRELWRRSRRWWKKIRGPSREGSP
jgi:hypothetical protein